MFSLSIHNFINSFKYRNVFLLTRREFFNRSNMSSTRETNNYKKLPRNYQRNYFPLGLLSFLTPVRRVVDRVCSVCSIFALRAICASNTREICTPQSVCGLAKYLRDARKSETRRSRERDGVPADI